MATGESGDADGPGAHHEDLMALLYTDGIPGAKRVDLLLITGHLPPLERPAEVTRLLDDFLGSAAR